MGYIVKKNVVLKDFRGAVRASGKIEYGGEKDYIELRFAQFVGESSGGKICELSPERETESTAKRYLFRSPYAAIDFIVCVCDGEPFYFSPDDKTNYTEVKRAYEEFVEKTSDEATGHKTYEYDDYAIAQDDYYRKVGSKFLRNGEKINAEYSQNDDAQKTRQRKEIQEESETFKNEYAENDEFVSEPERLDEVRRLALKIALYGGKSKLSGVIPGSLWLKADDCLIGIIGERFSPSYFARATATTRADFFGRENNLYPDSGCFRPASCERKTEKPPLKDKKFFVPESVFSSSEYGFSVTFEKLSN